MNSKEKKFKNKNQALELKHSNKFRASNCINNSVVEVIQKLIYYEAGSKS